MNEENNFEIINTENPIENSTIEQEKTFDFSNLDDELKKIDLSYVNDDINIVEPSHENTQKLFENDDDLNNNIETLDFNESNIQNSFEVQPESIINNQTNEDTLFETIELPKINETLTNNDETVLTPVNFELTKTDDYSLNSNDSVKPVVEDDVRFTFDENGVVTSITSTDEPVATEVLYDDEKEEIETPKIDNEKENSINNINSNREKINAEFARLNKIIELAKESGVADSEYLTDTFEKMEVFDSVNQRFNKDLDDYIASLNSDDLNNDSELSNMQF